MALPGSTQSDDMVSRACSYQAPRQEMPPLSARAASCWASLPRTDRPLPAATPLTWWGRQWWWARRSWRSHHGTPESCT